MSALEQHRPAIARMIHEDERRAQSLPASMRSASSWPLLLDLARADLAGEQPSATSLAIGARAPYATAKRHMDQLEAEGVIERRPDRSDRRVVRVGFTPKGRGAMIACLQRMEGGR